jgi:hypothetical protein
MASTQNNMSYATALTKSKTKTSVLNVEQGTEQQEKVWLGMDCINHIMMFILAIVTKEVESVKHMFDTTYLMETPIKHEQTLTSFPTKYIAEYFQTPMAPDTRIFTWLYENRTVISNLRKAIKNWGVNHVKVFYEQGLKFPIRFLHIKDTCSFIDIGFYDLELHIRTRSDYNFLHKYLKRFNNHILKLVFDTNNMFYDDICTIHINTSKNIIPEGVKVVEFRSGIKIDYSNIMKIMPQSIEVIIIEKHDKYMKPEQFLNEENMQLILDNNFPNLRIIKGQHDGDGRNIYFSKNSDDKKYNFNPYYKKYY